MDYSSRPLTILITIVSILLTLPTTIILIGSIFISLVAFISANDGGVTPVYLFIAVFLLLPGYSIFCLWWLILNYTKLPFKQIPRARLLGLALGCALSLPILYMYLSTGFKPPAEYISRFDNIKASFIFGGGPFITTVILGAYIWATRKTL